MTIGEIRQASGDLNAARRSYEEALEIDTFAAKDHHPSIDVDFDRRLDYERIGDVAKLQGDLAGAASAYSSGLDISQRLVAQSPAIRSV